MSFDEPTYVLPAPKKAPVPQFGVEAELRVVDPVTMFEIDQAARLYPAGAGSSDTPTLLGEYVYAPVPEFITSVIEMISKPAYPSELTAVLTEIFVESHRVGRANNVGLFSSALSVLPPIGGFSMNRGPRYDLYVDRYQNDARRSVTAGLHVHGTALDVDVRQEVRNRMSRFEPLLYAISAGAPVENATVTGRMSSRMTTYNHLPSTGTVPDHATPEEWQIYALERLRLLGLPHDPDDPKSLTWLHPYTRASVNHPTSEVRVLDPGMTADYDRFLVLLVAGLHATLLEEVEVGKPAAVELASHLRDDSCYVAGTYGLDAQLPDLFMEGMLVSARELFSATSLYIMPALEDLGVADDFRALAQQIVPLSSGGTTAQRVLRHLAAVDVDRERCTRRSPAHDLPASLLVPTAYSTHDGLLTLDQAQRLTAKLLAESQVGSVFGESQDAVRKREEEIRERMLDAMCRFTTAQLERLGGMMPLQRASAAVDLGLIQGDPH